MPLPVPEPGLVIRYLFLWSDASAQGHLEGDKGGRPAVIVSAKQGDATGKVRVAVLPITHAPPADASSSIEIPPAIKRQLALDDVRSWIRFDEINEFEWPGFDLRQIPGRRGSFAYGVLPPTFYARLVACLKERRARRQVAAIVRDEGAS